MPSSGMTLSEPGALRLLPPGVLAACAPAIRLAALVCLFFMFVARGASALGTSLAAISVEGLAAVTDTKYTWVVETATYPGGLNLKLGSQVGNLVISTNFTRTAAGTVGIVSGTIKVTNPAETDLQLTLVQAIIQQPAAGEAPQRSVAECPRNRDGHVSVGAGKTLACPFAQLLYNSTSPVTVQAQAAVAGAGQLLGRPVTVIFSSISGSVSNASTAAWALGRCAALSDTFMSGGLFLTPGAVAAGNKLPSLGSAAAVCDPTTSLYKVTFGPYGVDDMACGAYQVKNVARANVLGGDQPPVLDSSVILVSITGCPAAAPPSAPAAPSPPSTSNMRLPSDSIILGPQVSLQPSITAVAANPSNNGVRLGTSSSTSATATGATYATAASPVAPAAALPPTPAPSSPTNQYYYTYEYEAQIPHTSRHRRHRRRLMGYPSMGLRSTNITSSSSSNMAAAYDARSQLAAAAESIISQQSEQQQQHSEDWQDNQQQQQQQSQPEHMQGADAFSKGARLSRLQRQSQADTAEVAWESLVGSKATAGKQGASDMHDQLQKREGILTSVQLADATGQAPQLSATETAALQPSVRRLLLQQQLTAPSSALTEAFGLHGAAFDELIGNNSSQGLQTVVQVLGVMPGSTHYNMPRLLQSQQQSIPPKLLLDNISILQLDKGSQGVPLSPSLQQWRASRRQLLEPQLQQNSGTGGPVGPQFISASTFFGPAAVQTDGQPSLTFSAMQLGLSVVNYRWQPEVSVSPVAVDLQSGQSSSLQYTVRVTRSELPRRSILRGSFVITNPLESPLKLSEVSVEAPAAGKPAWTYVTASCGQGGTIASLLTTVVTVPANGQVTCSFSASYPSNAPDKGVLFARAVTNSGSQLVSDGFAFTRPRTKVPADQALQLGACAVFSDTFLTAADSPAVLTPTLVPATGSKAPAAATADSTGGVLLCSNTTYSYTVKLGPYEDGQCRAYQVVNQLRLRPQNGSSSTASSATTSVPVQITGCAPVKREAAAFMLASAAVMQGSEVATKLAPLTIGLQAYPYTDVTTYAWNITNVPTAAALKMHYQQALPVTFIVQYRKGAALQARLLTGTVVIQNPNLVEAATLVQVQVEVHQPGRSGPVTRVWAECPRDPVGVSVVAGQLLGGGVLTCSWSMQLLRSDMDTDLFSSISSARLVAVAVTSDGREIVSSPEPLNRIIKSDSNSGSNAESCVAVSNTFQRVGSGGEVLLQPSSSGSGSSLLAGENGGGRAADVVCDSLSVSYGVTYGPLSRYQCGVHRTTNMAVASSLTNTGRLTAAASTATVIVTGCPGALTSLSVAGLQLQLVKAVEWNVTGSVSGPAAAGPVRAAVGQSIDIPIGLKYIYTAVKPQRQLVGSIQVSSTGTLPLVVSQVVVEVTPLNAVTMAVVPLVIWTAVCPTVSMTDEVTVRSAGSISCSFAGQVPANLIGVGSVVARLQLSDGSDAASPAVVFDFSQHPAQLISRNRCAIASDHFLVGNGLLQPIKTTRPATVAAPTQICTSQSVSFVATVGPFTKEQCGQLLTVINLSRASPVSAMAVQPPSSHATVVRLNVTGDCAA